MLPYKNFPYTFISEWGKTLVIKSIKSRVILMKNETLQIIKNERNVWNVYIL